MSFEPTFDECLKCTLYRLGDGDNSISHCLADGSPIPVPDFCPMNDEQNYDPWQDWRDAH